MDGKLLLMFLDVLVLAALGGTVYMMRNLISSIKVIRDGKTELQQHLQQLNIHISNAQMSIESMKKLADEKGRALQKNIDEATSVIEELQFIQKAADNVAQRLEKLTENASAPVKADTEARITAATKPQQPLSKAEKELADAMARRAGKAIGE